MLLVCFILLFSSCQREAEKLPEQDESISHISALNLRIPEGRNLDEILSKFPEGSLTVNEKNAIISLIKWGDINSHVDHPKQLKEINIQYNYKITNQDIQFLKEFPSLETLYLVNCPEITDKGMTILDHLPHLKLLSLGGTNVTEESVPRIAKLTNLKTLYLSVAYVRDNPITPVDESVEGNPPQFGDKTLEMLKSLPLTTLAISSPTTITDEGLLCLVTMKNLGDFSVLSNFVTLNGAEYLATLPHLKSVRIHKRSSEDIILKKIQNNDTLVLYDELNEKEE